MGPLCPISIYGSPVALLKFQMAPRLILLMSSGSKKKEPRYTCLSETRASYSQRMWAEVSSSAAHLLHNGLSDSPIRWRCLLRVLYPVRRPATALDCVLLKDRNLALAPQLEWTVCRQERILHLQGIEETLGHPAHNLVTILTELAYLCVYQVVTAEV
jgi:hypothetical protein